MRKRTHIHTRPPKHGKELLILKTMSCHSRLYLNLKQSYVYKYFYVYCICNNKYTLFRSLTYIEVKVIQSENRSQTYILVHGTHCYNMTVYYNDIKCIINTLWGKFCIQDLNIYLGHWPKCRSRSLIFIGPMYVHKIHVLYEFQKPSCLQGKDMNYYLRTDGRTDRRTKAIYKSPPEEGLKSWILSYGLT